MLERMLEELKKLDDAENMFGKEFINLIQCNELSDVYTIRVEGFPYLKLDKEVSFASSYFELIGYLTDIKSWYMNGGEPHDETSFYRDWIVFKKAYNIRMAWFYLNVKNTGDDEEVRGLFIDILGWANYHAIVECFNTASEDFRGHGRLVMRYVGNTRAIRNLCLKYLDDEHGHEWPFHLWHLTAYTLIEKYGFIFYLGNEMDKLEFCPYDYTAQEYYYNDLYKKILDFMDRDVPKNEHLTEQMKQATRRQVEREIFEESRKREDLELYEEDLKLLEEEMNLDDMEACDIEDGEFADEDF